MKAIDTTELDVLTEIGTIGAGNATTALSVMLNSKLSMKIPKVSFMGFDEFVDSIGGAENVIAAVLSNINGEVKGFVLFAIDIKDVYQLVSRLSGIELNMDNGYNFSEFDLSAIKEIGNILISSYLSSMETLTGLQLRPSMPRLTIDMAGAILNLPAIVDSREHDEVLRIESQIEGVELAFQGHLMMIPAADSYKMIRERLGL